MSTGPKRLPIGVFDSGLGGLTVVRELRATLPAEQIVYLGDTARVPYGTKSPATVIRYARGCARLLADVGVKALVIACNTASAVALEILRAELDLPVIGVVEPGAHAAVAAARELELHTGMPAKIGVLGTASTVQSAAYPKEVKKLSSTTEIVQQPAPLLVPLVEEGWIQGEVPSLAADRYVGALLEEGARVIVLGCTHYPLLKPVIEQRAQALSGADVRVVDGARATALALAELLSQRDLLTTANDAVTGSRLRLLVSDVPGAFQLTAGRFLGEAVPDPEQVDIVPV